MTSKNDYDTATRPKNLGPNIRENWTSGQGTCVLQAPAAVLPVCFQVYN